MKPADPNQHAGDAELVRRAQAGDEEAVAAIYRNNAQAIFRYVLNRVGDEAAAEDLTSEVFLRAVQSLPGYRHRGAPLAAWLYRIARDRVTDYHRANARRSTVALDDGLFDTRPDPETLLVRRAESEQVNRALTRLTPDQRDVLFFRFTEGLSLEKTAGLMGKTTGAIKALQFRALQALARNLR
jgi:RNA polymerase sigma-70 factor (ECF subfamily)